MSTLFSVSLRIISGLVCLGIFTNSTCLYVMFRHRRKLMVLDSCRFLANQSLIDLLANVMLLISTAMLQYGDDVVRACTVLHAILCFFMRVLFEASTQNLVLTVLEKYIKVVHPIRHRNHVNARVINGMLVFPWIFSLTSMALQTGGQRVDRTEGTCYYNLSTPWRYIADLWAFLIGYLLPMTALIGCHVAIFNKLNKRRVGVTASASTAQMCRSTNNIHQPQGSNQSQVPAQGQNRLQVSSQGRNQPQVLSHGLNQLQVPPQGLNQLQVPPQGPNQQQVQSQGPNQLQVPHHSKNQLQLLPTQGQNEPQVSPQSRNQTQLQLQGPNQPQGPNRPQGSPQIPPQIPLMCSNQLQISTKSARSTSKPAENRVIRAVFTVSMAFVFCYTVYFIAVFASFVVGLESVQSLFLLAGILATTNVVINPCIYVLQFKQFRESFFEMMTSFKCW